MGRVLIVANETLCAEAVQRATAERAHLGSPAPSAPRMAALVATVALRARRPASVASVARQEPAEQAERAVQPGRQVLTATAVQAVRVATALPV